MQILQSNRLRKWLVGFSLSLVLSIQILAAFVPLQAKAIVGAPDVVAALTGKWSNDAVVEGVLASSLGALVNGFSYFMRKLAYDSASWLASSAVGQKPLVFQEGGESYFKTVALDSAATAIEQFGAPFGLNLCKPPDIKFQIFLQVSLRRLYEDPTLAGGPQPTCRWNEFSTAWENGFENFDQKAGDFASQMFAKSLKVDQSDMGVALGMISKVDRINAQAKAGANTDRLEGGGFKAVTDLISGNIKTPSQVIAEETKALTGGKQQELTSQQIAGIYGAGLWQVIPAAGGVFLNTFISQLTDKVFNGFFEPDGSSTEGATASSVFNEYAGVINNNRAAAQNAFGFLFTAVPTQELTTYPLLEEFSDCSNPDNPGLNTCVADPGLVLAVKQATTGEALTIREAIDKGFLHGDWAFVPPQHEFNSDPRKCYNSGFYCFSNLQKLRKARILPLGFEIAASKADPDNLKNWTLKAAKDGFYNCNDSGLADEKHPFCHLIDPEWIIRLPEPRCEAKVNGPRLLANNNADRREECADISTCLAQDDKGRCIGNYGYCLREKNTWRFRGSSCPQQFSSCSTYTNARDNTKVSYLSRTLQTGQCDAQSVGCQKYSVSPLANGSWENDPVLTDYDQEAKGKKPTIYFNESIKDQTCPSSAEGCSALVKVDSDGAKGETVYLKKAPASLFTACYQVSDPDNNILRWPQNPGEITQLSKRPQAKLCAPFAPACTKNDVGCEAYTPDNSSDQVYGIVGSNRCSASCVGYDTFKQEQPENKGAFEPEVFPLYFIPTEPAKKCDLIHDGCSEFTNIDAANVGGEKLEYYSDLLYCERPAADNKNQKTFYSWEGKDNEGYVLRTHKLRPVSSDSNDRYSASFISAVGGATLGASFPVGSPAYADFNPEVMNKLQAECNKTAYDAAVTNPYGVNTAKPGCVAFYDDTEAVFYRMQDKVVTVSAACHPLRKTDSYLREDSYLTNLGQSSACVAKGGRWTDTNKCELCYNGGIYQNGACVYWTTSAGTDATSCPASANNCRAYTGKDANNTLAVVDQKFEPGIGTDALVTAKQGWGTSTAIKPESLIGSQNSLEVSNSTVDYTFVDNTLEGGKSYELEFWARGAAVNLEIEFFNLTSGQSIGAFTRDPSTGQTVKVPISSTWQAYRLGPIEFKGVATDKIALRFKRSTVGGPAGPYNYFIDNFKVIRITGKVPLIKNSWKRLVSLPDGGTTLADAPLECDANPTDGLPGGALGCRAYTDSLGKKVPTTGFDRLCRPEAVGCTAFVDTQNTVDETQATAYNLICKGTQNTTCTITVNSNTNLGSCTIGAGQTYCHVKKAVLPDTVTPGTSTVPKNTLTWLKDGGYFDASTIVAPADTAANDPIYLANRKAFACNQTNPADSSQYLGCQKVALQEPLIPGNPAGGFKYSETFVKNNPDNYSQILCANDQIGCGEFKSGNTVSFFKDPATAGAPICSYKDSLKIGGTTISGWFQDGVGNCSGLSALSCKKDSDCSAVNAGTCQNMGAVPCYSNYAIAGGSYGIWSNESPQYNGSAGRCPDQYNQCVEIVDPLDTSAQFPGGHQYHVILDQKLQNNVGDCEGKVNLKNGCALFNVTNNPTKTFNAVETYKLSDGINVGTGAKYNPVEPNVITKPFDTNILLKVDRDRSCSEWLSCKDKVRITDKDGKVRTLCAQYKACRSTETGVDCSEWSPAVEENATPLTETKYAQRNVTWYGEDYSGYSLFNKFQAADMISVSFEGDPIAYLGYYLDPADYSGNANSALQAAASCDTKKEWAKCGVDDGGRCYEKRCVYPITGAFPSTVAGNKTEVVKFLETGSCKAFPEKTSPFGDSIALGKPSERLPAYDAGTQAADYTRRDFEQKIPGFEGANICQSGNCSCEYKKITYKNNATVDYYAKDRARYPSGVCTEGDKDGQACQVDQDCATSNGDTIVASGICSAVRDIEVHTGLRGFCLEYDLSRPINRQKNEFACLTWLPVDTAATNYDLYNKYPEAGYLPAYDAVTSVSGAKKSETGQVYCTEATGLGLGAINTSLISSLNQSDYPFNGFNSYTGALQTIEDKTAFMKRNYAVAQMWAWSGSGLKPYPDIPNSAYTIVDFNGNPFPDSVYLEQWFPKPNTSPGFMSPADFKSQIQDKIPAVNFSAINPNAVVLFTSGLSYDTYFQGFPRRETYVNMNKDAKASGGGVCIPGTEYYDDETGYFDCKYTTDSQEISYCKQTSVQGSCARIFIGKLDKPSSQLPSDAAKAYGNHYNIRGNITLYKEEVAKLKYGPILAPPNMMNNTSTAKVLTIDFDFLNSIKKITRTSVGSTKYDLQAWGTFGNQSGYFTFKITILDGANKDKTRYGIVALSDNGTNLGKMPDGVVAQLEGQNLTEHLKLFDEVVDSLADFNSIGIDTPKLTKWKEISGHSFIGIFTTFDQNNRYSTSGYTFRYDSNYSYLYDNFLKSPDQANQKVTPYFAEVAELKPRCVEFAQVYNDVPNPNDPTQTTNKAYTNRVWQYAKEIKDLFLGVTKNSNLPLFGSTNLQSNFMSATNWQNTLRLYVFRDSVADGAFLSCLGQGIDVKQSSLGVPHFNQAMAGMKFGDPFWDNYSCYRNSTDNSYKNISVDPDGIGGQIELQKIFRKTFTVASYKDGKWVTAATVDTSDQTNSGLYPPQIYALNTAKCFGTGTCTAGKADAFTLNRRNGTTESAEDLNQDGLTDPLVAKGSFLANLNFFGFADHNRMPIKRVMIDWGDTSITNQKRYGEYKNRKPFCLDNDTDLDPGVKECSNAPQLTCKSDSDCPGTGSCNVNGHNFGNSTRACQAGYFEFIHSFTCSQSDKATGKAYVKNFGDTSVDNRIWAELGRQNYNATINPFVCVFQPKVQIQDNWGWCTGKCGDANLDGKTDYKDGCYSNQCANGVITDTISIVTPLSIIVVP